MTGHRDSEFLNDFRSRVVVRSFVCISRGLIGFPCGDHRYMRVRGNNGLNSGDPVSSNGGANVICHGKSLRPLRRRIM